MNLLSPLSLSALLSLYAFCCFCSEPLRWDALLPSVPGSPSSSLLVRVRLFAAVAAAVAFIRGLGRAGSCCFCFLFCYLLFMCFDDAVGGYDMNMGGVAASKPLLLPYALHQHKTATTLAAALATGQAATTAANASFCFLCIRCCSASHVFGQQRPGRCRCGYGDSRRKSRADTSGRYGLVVYTLEIKQAAAEIAAWCSCVLLSIGGLLLLQRG